MALLQKLKKFFNPKGFKVINNEELKIQLTNKINNIELFSHNELDIIFEDRTILRITGSESLYFTLSKEIDRN